MAATRGNPLRETPVHLPNDLYDVAMKHGRLMQDAMLPLVNGILDTLKQFGVDDGPERCRLAAALTYSLAHVFRDMADHDDADALMKTPPQVKR